MKLEKDLAEVKKKWFHRKEQKELEGKIETKKTRLDKAKDTLDLLPMQYGYQNALGVTKEMKVAKAELKKIQQAQKEWDASETKQEKLYLTIPANVRNVAKWEAQERIGQKRSIHDRLEEKKQIAKYAASLIEPGDFVYVDAGSSTEYLVEYIEERDASYVTNSMSHALKLAGRGMKVSILGGNVKGTTEAVVGADAMETLRRYHFTRGFWGADGIRKKEGCTTPEMEEAAVKRLSMKQTRECYVLCDGSKFGKIAQVTFAELADVTVITAGLKDKKYKKYENIVEVEDI